jgi:hypothetical protein
MFIRLSPPHKMKTLLSLVVALFLSGCIHTPAYNPPIEGPTATIEFKNDSQRDLQIAFYEEAYGCKRRRNVPLLLPTTSASHTVYANRPLAFQYYLRQIITTARDGTHESYCLINLGFTPEENHKYSFKTSEKAYSCEWKMVDMTNGKKPENISLDVMQWTTPWSENTSFCPKNPKYNKTGIK